MNIKVENADLAQVLDRIASLLEIRGEVAFKTIAYRRAAQSLRDLPEEALSLRQKGKLEEVPGVGKAIAKKIEELLDTGRLEYLEKLELEVPPTLIDLLNIPEIGPKKVALFWQMAGIVTVDQLEKAALAGELRNLPGIGERSEGRLLEGIKTYRQQARRYPLPVARAILKPLLKWLAEQPGVIQVQAAGSLRRWKPDIGDLDLVMASTAPLPVLQAFTERKEVRRVRAMGEYKTSVELENGLRVQLWCQPPERFGSLLQFVTGSKGHNVRLREYALKQGYSLSERGLVDVNGVEQLFAEEADLYQALGLPWIPPELREDRGEIKAALEGRLRHLIGYDDLVADLHLHTVWSDGEGTITEMIEKARSIGRQVLAVTDHSFLINLDGASSLTRLEQQRVEISRLRQEMKGEFTLLQGVEVDILSDGSLALPDETLKELDVVVASLHSGLDQPGIQLTSRLVKAMQNPHVDIIGHPSGRSLPYFDGADLNWDLIFDTAKQNNVALEINSNPGHLDLDEHHARQAADRGVLLCINTDAHAPRQLSRQYGVAVARRAWISPEQVLSAWQAEKILHWLKHHRSKGANSD